MFAAGAPLLAQSANPVVEARRLTNFGVDAALEGLWSEAVFRWEQAIEAYPGLPSAHNNLGVVYEHFGKYDLAKMHYALAMEMSHTNRFVESNNRMFLQFFFQQVRQTESRRKSRSDEVEEASGEETGEEAAAEETAPGEAPDDLQLDLTASDGDYHKVGGPQQVIIKHPKRETPLSGKYRRLYIAGFSPVKEDAVNLNFETTEYLRSEMRKYTLYDVIPLEELTLPKDEDEFYDLVDDEEFWRSLGVKVGADLVVTGRVDFYSEMSDGIYPYEYRDRYTGDYRTAQLMIPRTAFTVELELFFHDAATGELVHEESFAQTIVYRGRLDPTLQAFFDVMNRIIPRFMDILVPREHDAIRFLLKG
jgi:AraC-like DNA-binding protein